MGSDRHPRRRVLHLTPEQLAQYVPTHPGIPEAVVARAMLRRVIEGRAVVFEDGTVEMREGAAGARPATEGKA